MPSLTAKPCIEPAPGRLQKQSNKPHHPVLGSFRPFRLLPRTHEANCFPRCLSIRRTRVQPSVRRINPRRLSSASGRRRSALPSRWSQQMFMLPLCTSVVRMR